MTQDKLDYNISKSRVIHTVPAEHYSFTAEELNFIINCDTRCRMGKELERCEMQ